VKAQRARRARVRHKPELSAEERRNAHRVSVAAPRSRGVVSARASPSMPRRAPAAGQVAKAAGVRSCVGGLGMPARSSVASNARAAPALARNSPSIAEWLSERCESAPSRWSLLGPRVLVREQLILAEPVSVPAQPGDRERQRRACKAPPHSATRPWLHPSSRTERPNAWPGRKRTSAVRPQSKPATTGRSWRLLLRGLRQGAAAAKPALRAPSYSSSLAAAALPSCPQGLRPISSSSCGRSPARPPRSWRRCHCMRPCLCARREQAEGGIGAHTARRIAPAPIRRPHH
jgi:hypothetical protein